MAEADPRGHKCSSGNNSPTSLIVEGLLVQPRMYHITFCNTFLQGMFHFSMEIWHVTWYSRYLGLELLPGYPFGIGIQVWNMTDTLQEWCMERSDYSVIRQNDSFLRTTAHGANHVIATALPSVRLPLCLSHAGTLSRQLKIGSHGLHCEIAKTLVFWCQQWLGATCPSI